MKKLFNNRHRERSKAISRLLRRFTSRNDSIIVVSTLIVIFFISPSFVQAAIPNHHTPKIANYYLHWTVSEGEARELAKWDIIILDMEVASRTPDAIRLIHSLNPDAKVLAYITPAEIRQDADTLSSISPLRYRLSRHIASEWYLTSGRGDRLSFWGGTWILNLTDRCPVSSGRQWSDALVDFVRDDILSSGLWDGVLFDNAWESIGTFAGQQVDLNHDGSDEPIRQADETWRAGMRALYAKARARLPAGTLIMENDGPLYSPDVQGVLFESFPRGGWTTRIRQIERAGLVERDPKVVMVNSNTENTGRRDDYRRFRFGLTSALLHDAYASFDYGDQDHGQTWWYDEYDAVLGDARGAARRVDVGVGNGVWQRDYGKGLVLVNAQTVPKTVRLRGEVERLRGVQDPAANSGQISSEVTLAGEDGLVLLRTIQTITGAAYRNGSFARILRSDGSSVRAGFFSEEAAASAGALVLRADLGTDGRAELIRSQNGTVDVLDANGAFLYRLQPYGPRFRSPISVAVGDVDGDGTREIITVPASGGGAHVKIYDNRGRFLREFFAIDARFQGGASVAAADLTGDGRAEIVIGAGSGGAPLVRVFGGNGGVLQNGFYAYSAAFRGGVSVAAGDVDADDRSEIITGAGPGGGPHVRIFNLDGTARGGFFAYEPSHTSGLMVGVADVDGDGRNEIIAFSNP